MTKESVHKSFLLYCDQVELIEKLTDEQAGFLIKKIYGYCGNGRQNPNIQDPMLDMVFTSMKIALDKCMAGHLNNYNTFIKYELNVAAVVNEDVYACKLQTVIARATQRMNRLYALAESLRDISNAYLNVQRVKLAIMKSIGN